MGARVGGRGESCKITSASQGHDGVQVPSLTSTSSGEASRGEAAQRFARTIGTKDGKSPTGHKEV